MTREKFPQSSEELLEDDCQSDIQYSVSLHVAVKSGNLASIVSLKEQ